MLRPAHIPDLERDLVATAARMTAPAAPAHRRRTALTAVAGATLAAAIALMSASGSNPDASASPVRSGGQVLGEYFAVFRRPADGGSDNPFRRSPPRLEVDPSTARRLRISGHELWVAASHQQVCLFARSSIEPPSQSGVCAHPVLIERDGLFGMSHPSPATIKTANLPTGTTEIVGFVPDGVATVTFSLADGSKQQTPVIDNAIALTVPSSPKSVTFLDRHGARHTART